jgi:hypothetical protein
MWHRPNQQQGDSMNISRLIQTVVLGSAILMGGQALATPSQFSEMELCVGDSESVRAPAGTIFTYTEAKFAEGIPSMMDELNRYGYFGSSNSDEAATPSWMELRPNQEFLVGGDMNLLHYPNHYVDHIATSKRSRVVIQARSEGMMTVEYFAMNVQTKETLQHIVNVTVHQCGTATSVKQAAEESMCEGEARFKGGTMKVVRGEDSLYLFRGALSGNQFLAGTAPGRAMLRIFTDSKNVQNEQIKIFPEGKAGCGYSDMTRLEALEGENAYVLQLCEGDTWIAPTARTIEGLTYTGSAIAAEASVRDDGFAITGMTEGLSMLSVNFNHGDAAPMAIYAEVLACD